MDDKKWFAREYYTLDRAARELNSDVDDILHLGVIGAINICSLLDGQQSTLVVWGFDDPEDLDGNLYDLFDQTYGVMRFSQKLISPNFLCVGGEHATFCSGGASIFLGVAHGLWAISSHSLRTIERKGFAEISHVGPDCWQEFRENTGLTVRLAELDQFYRLKNINREINKSDLITATRDDLYISPLTLKKLKDNNGESFGNLFNGGVIQDEQTGEDDAKFSSKERVSASAKALIVLLMEKEGISVDTPTKSAGILEAMAKSAGYDMTFDPATVSRWCQGGRGELKKNELPITE